MVLYIYSRGRSISNKYLTIIIFTRHIILRNDVCQLDIENNNYTYYDGYTTRVL